jgi:hypothetical protein
LACSSTPTGAGEDADIVRLLLARGASLTVEENQFHATPAGWFEHGLNNRGDTSNDYAEVARLLLASEAVIPSEGIPTGHADVDDVLREHGLIK